MPARRNGTTGERAVRLSEPVHQLFASTVRVLEWKGERGETHLKVVAADISAETVDHTIARHVSGTQYIFVDARAPL